MRTKYSHELPPESGNYPMYMDSADMHLQAEANYKLKKELRIRLLQQIKERGYTNCGMTSEAQVEKVFGQYK